MSLPVEWAQARVRLAAADTVWAKARAEAPEEVPPDKAEVVPAGDPAPGEVKDVKYRLKNCCMQ